MKFSLNIPRIPQKYAKYQRIAKWVGYPLLYLIAFGFFCYLSFPYDQLKQRVIAGFNSSQSGPEASRMEIEDLSWSWRFPGIAASGVRIIGPEPVSPPTVGGTGDKPEEGEEAGPERRVITLDDVYARVAPLSYVFGTTAVSFGGDAFGGSLDGTYRQSDEVLEFSLELEDVEAGQVPELEKTVGLPLSGVMNLKMDVRMAEGKASEAEGEIDLRIDDLTVGDGKAKIRNTLALPKVAAGTLVLKASATKGQLTIEEFSADGDDLKLDSAGKIKLRDRLMTSIVDLTLSFQFTDKYKNKNDITKGLFGDGKAPGLFDLDPQIKRAKGASGDYTWRVSGGLSHLRFTPSAGSSLLKGGGRTGAAGNKADKAKSKPTKRRTTSKLERMKQRAAARRATTPTPPAPAQLPAPPSPLTQRTPPPAATPLPAPPAATPPPAPPQEEAEEDEPAEEEEAADEEDTEAEEESDDEAAEEAPQEAEASGGAAPAE